MASGAERVWVLWKEIPNSSDPFRSSARQRAPITAPPPRNQRRPSSLPLAIVLLHLTEESPLHAADSASPAFSQPDSAAIHRSTVSAATPACILVQMLGKEKQGDDNPPQMTEEEALSSPMPKTDPAEELTVRLASLALDLDCSTEAAASKVETGGGDVVAGKGEKTGAAPTGTMLGVHIFRPPIDRREFVDSAASGDWRDEETKLVPTAAEDADASAIRSPPETPVQQRLPRARPLPQPRIRVAVTSSDVVKDIAPPYGDEEDDEGARTLFGTPNAPDTPHPAPNPNAEAPTDFDPPSTVDPLTAAASPRAYYTVPYHNSPLHYYQPAYWYPSPNSTSAELAHPAATFDSSSASASGASGAETLHSGTTKSVDSVLSTMHHGDQLHHHNPQPHPNHHTQQGYFQPAMYSYPVYQQGHAIVTTTPQYQSQVVFGHQQQQEGVSSPQMHTDPPHEQGHGQEMFGSPTPYYSMARDVRARSDMMTESAVAARPAPALLEIFAYGDGGTSEGGDR
ncbi:hypothetical protein BDK51DRAFT_52747 [Blyttiomyces helicus]|uniref:Uncharacterized protein n=1 Tax=Blyttiomyces helicus TaxID=388810 RepID=A0A4P9WCH3_9FUNG|nr:hypothetical protein BDK51DRAFT_52747 [Blyttiomyces helicus]|eukprot:RKO89303.1 hypothetical protein BDK51DRAFT_52747 [Blyttiomyces helicus]